MNSVLNYNLLSRQSPLAINLMADRNRERKVVFYGRVSTEHEAQLSALENQMQWYEDQAKYHSNWNVLDRYIDEGITGTQAKKRPAFLKMIEDAKLHKFDLIVTREVCRFARNTVDTLIVTRELKNIGIEVFFVEDNIWTMDGDGELRLTIMATLAQEESRKVSERVKAGQKISRDNGVLYGNGNILGYNRSSGTYVINEEQAETVRMIYNLYEERNGMTKIARILTERKRKDAIGNVSWCASKISRILKNSTYRGIQGYFKSFSNNYLEQKRINNHDSSTYMYVKGDFPAIISEEQWERCEKIREEKIVDNPNDEGKKRVYGKKATVHRWLSKLRCSCGSSYRKNLWHRNKSGAETYGYQCYNQLNHGSKQLHEKNELPTEGLCGNKMITDWKLDCMAQEIFKLLCIDKKTMISEIFDTLNKYAKSAIAIQRQDTIVQERRLEKAKNKIKNLINMRAEGEISKDDFSEMKMQLDEEVRIITAEIERTTLECNEESTELYDSATIQQALEEMLSFSAETLDKEIVDRFVYQIVQKSDDHFVWFLNLQPGKKQMLVAKVQGRKGKSMVELIPSEGTIIGDDINLSETKKDGSKEFSTSLEPSEYTYKSINLKPCFVQGELVDLFQGSLCCYQQKWEIIYELL